MKTNEPITPARIRRAWKPAMTRLGFRPERSMFLSYHGPIRHSVAIQRLRYSGEAPAYLLNLYVRIHNPFEPGTLREHQVFTPAYLERNGVRHRIHMYWPALEALEAHSCFERFAPAYFQRLADLDTLIEIVIAASANASNIQDHLAGPYVIPNDPLVIEFLGHTALMQAAMPRQVPFLNDELLSLLYWHRGDRANAIETVAGLRDRCRDGSLYASETRARMELRLAAMRR